ncbi:N-acetylmuramoyl-L-alanine amidase [Corynebacterium sp. p3-SID1145]|uniref:N-acetylmuramoyl-L-alanine amidase n=1 Tax=unclassified Corynebacterium TaxID=2624378 RepID=UPI0021A9B1CB|nr:MULTISPECIES: N-acetylmuramoyl-L-alanine amidase [unclassified Corynebacterium]MCT1453106.1 N-acetylmuramoyl-L-alanine amidase [Corynebacterium sp. p3-SID1145]MCT1462217.1 N-acetylmuramoyl-L-alanine amidase [Corynebacterium sp. p3-SID1140]
MKQRRRLNPSSARKTPVLAAVTSVALVAAGAFGGNEILKTQDVGGGEVNVTSSTASFGDGENVVVDDAAIAAQGEGDENRTVKEFTRDEEFSIFGLTWTGERDIAAYVRAQRADGTWSEWYHMQPEPGPEGSEIQGTEPIYVEPTKKIQVSTANVDLGETNLDTAETVTDQDAIPEVPEESLPSSDVVDVPNVPDSAAPASIGDLPRALPSNLGDIAPVADVEELGGEASEEAPAPAGAGTSANDLEAVFIDGGEGTADGGIAPAQSNTNGMPRVVSRSSWGAGSSSNPTYTEPVKAATVHHTAGSNNYSAAQAPGVVRGIWQYHAVTRGWGDIGYNALVDKYGNIYEGRAGGLDRAVEGAHVGAFNQHTFGVSMMGDYSTASPSNEALRAMGEIIGWKAAVAKFDPKGSSYLEANFNFSGSKFRAGQGKEFPNINAHRDFHYNDCPGDNLYAQMDTIRNYAKSKYDQINGGNTSVWQPSTPKQDDNTNTADTTGTTGTTGDSGRTGTTGTVGNNDGTTTTINNLANTSSQISFEKVLSGDPAAIAAAAGTVAGALLLAAASNGMIPSQVARIANLEVLPGMTLSSMRPLIGQAINLVGSDEAKETWGKLEPTLGQLDGVLQGVGGDQYAIFEKGIAILTGEGEEIVMPEKVADAWLKQGMDLGPLGRPVKSDSAANNGDVRVEFQRGSIFYTANTGNVDVNVEK